MLMLPEPKKLIDRKEAIRYLGYGKHTPDPEILFLLEECEEELIALMRPAYLWLATGVRAVDEGLLTEEGGLLLTGTAIRKHLNGCDQAVISCSTLGSEVDRRIEEIQKQDMLKALLLDAEANSAIERLRLFVGERVAENYPDFEVRWQFGIGYGDLPLELQPEILKLLSAKERIGLTSNEHNILTPLKSVSGILGLQRKQKPMRKNSKNIERQHLSEEKAPQQIPEREARQQGCINCNKKDTCTYRKISLPERNREAVLADGEVLQYREIRSSRKTLAIEIGPDGFVTVRVPAVLSGEQVERFLKEKTVWLRSKQELAKERLSAGGLCKRRQYMDGESILLQGREIPLHVELEPRLKKAYFYLTEDGLTIRLPDADTVKVKQLLGRWYREYARAVFRERADYFKKIIGCDYASLRIKEQKSCYGSCSSGGNLNFNWLCILAPPEILDYVVVHELCHCKHMDHSMKFWAEVEKVLPDYKERRNWLKQNGRKLYW